MSLQTKISLYILLLLLIHSTVACKTVTSFLDRRGVSIHAKFEKESTDVQVSSEKVVSVLQKRLNSLGIDGKVTDKSENEIEVKLYGKKGRDAETVMRVKRLLFESYQLELKAVISDPSPSPLKTYVTKDEAAEKATSDQEILPYKDWGGTTTKYLIVKKKAIVNGADVLSAETISLGHNPDSISIGFRLNPEGAEKFGYWTAMNISNYIAVVLNKQVISAAYIRSQIKDQGQIDGRFTVQEAQEIAAALSSGYLPVKFQILEENFY